LSALKWWEQEFVDDNISEEVFEADVQKELNRVNYYLASWKLDKIQQQKALEVKKYIIYLVEEYELDIEGLQDISVWTSTKNNTVSQTNNIESVRDGSFTIENIHHIAIAMNLESYDHDHWKVSDKDYYKFLLQVEAFVKKNKDNKKQMSKNQKGDYKNIKYNFERVENEFKREYFHKTVQYSLYVTKLIPKRLETLKQANAKLKLLINRLWQNPNEANKKVLKSELDKCLLWVWVFFRELHDIQTDEFNEFLDVQFNTALKQLPWSIQVYLDDYNKIMESKFPETFENIDDSMLYYSDELTNNDIGVSFEFEGTKYNYQKMQSTLFLYSIINAWENVTLDIGKRKYNSDIEWLAGLLENMWSVKLASDLQKLVNSYISFILLKNWDIASVNTLATNTRIDFKTLKLDNVDISVGLDKDGLVTVDILDFMINNPTSTITIVAFDMEYIRTFDRSNYTTLIDWTYGYPQNNTNLIKLSKGFTTK